MANTYNKCNTRVLGDELHFMLVCNHFANERKEMLSIVEKTVNNFEKLNVEQRLI